MSERLNGPEDLSTLIILQKLAEVYRNQGRLADAELKLRTVVEVHDRNRQHNFTLSPMGSSSNGRLPDDYGFQALSDLDAVHQLQGRFAKAKSLMQLRRKRLQMRYGDTDGNTLSGYSALVALYMDQGCFAEAEPLLCRVL